METFDSKGEEYLSWYFEELKKAGYISHIEYQPEPFKLTDKVVNLYEKKLKTKTKILEQTLLSAHEYTCDFKIYWNLKAVEDNLIISLEDTDKRKILNHHFIFNLEDINDDGEITDFNIVSYIEAKPDLANLKKYDQNNMNRLVRTIIKQVYNKFGTYVQLVFHNKLFSYTFTPNKYLVTDKTLKKRVIHYETRSLKEYIKLIKI